MSSFASASIVLANAGVPMLALQFPILVLLLVPIMALEAAILSRVLQLSWRVALRLAAFANVASTLIGVPLTWGVLFGVELLASGAAAHGLSTNVGRFHSAVLQAPWLIPYEDDIYWLVPVANLVLLPFYFLVSAYVEQWVVRRSRGDLDFSRVRRATWLANAASYALAPWVSRVARQIRRWSIARFWRSASQRS